VGKRRRKEEGWGGEDMKGDGRCYASPIENS